MLVNGIEHAYTFTVTVSSPDTGCDRYADWWEIVTANGVLEYRHTLLHSHVDEQPFTRSGGPVPIGAKQEVVVRAHMNSLGYGAVGLQGNVASGFVRATLLPEFGASIESLDPQPPPCLSFPD